MAARTTCETGRRDFMLSPKSKHAAEPYLSAPRNSTTASITDATFDTIRIQHAHLRSRRQLLQIEPPPRCSTKSITRVPFLAWMPPFPSHRQTVCLFLRIRMLRGREPCHPVLKERETERDAPTVYRPAIATNSKVMFLPIPSDTLAIKTPRSA